ncbi:hypothetical protein FSP39_024177 [Pinctada imbricata]|uniref:Uncharacterized protein n=1 Tax=Pinctada imbricata TaxID=66713 RepID=A0AA89C7I6_PINIB|nr:hypothetical protein FSP39_024177 [Pinctada imbricata]
MYFFFFKGKHLTLVVQKKESYKVEIGSGECLISELRNDTIVCRPPSKKPNPKSGDGEKLIIRVKVARLTIAVGEAEYIGDFNYTPVIIVVSLIVFIVLVVGGLLLNYYYRRKNRKEINKMVMEMKEMEEQTKEDGKEEFADMQLMFGHLKQYIGTSGVPYHEYQKYIIKVLFQGKETAVHALLTDGELNDNVRAALDSFEALLCNKFFMKSMIGTIEKQKKITMPDNVVEYLLSALVEKNKKQQKVLFNRFENITLRLLINWLSICVFPYYQSGGASSLFVLYRAIETVVEKRPADHITGDAKNTLSQDSFLTEKVEFKAIRLLVDFDKDGKEIPCDVLDCDTISQVKHKCLRQIFMHQNKPASQMPSIEDINLEWRMGDRGKHILNDIDLTSLQEGSYIKMNTLRHYNVKDNTKIILSYKFSPDQDDSHCGKTVMKETRNFRAEILYKPLFQVNIHLYFQVKEVDDEGNTLNRRNIAQVHLKMGKGLHITSLMHTKMNCHQFYGTVFSTLDGLGDKNNVDQETLQCWKSECYAIRIWSILTEHPDLLFDIDKPKHVDWCLQSIRQLLLDCFHSTKITKDSSLQKLLFAAEIPEYQRKVQEFFSAMSAADPLPTNQFIEEMTSISNVRGWIFCEFM